MVVGINVSGRQVAWDQNRDLPQVNTSVRYAVSRNGTARSEVFPTVLVGLFVCILIL